MTKWLKIHCTEFARQLMLNEALLLIEEMCVMFRGSLLCVGMPAPNLSMQDAFILELQWKHK